MKPTCKEYRDVMVEHALGELEGLPATRLEAHLDNCGACARVYDRLKAGLHAAQTYDPEVPGRELERLERRLEPYLEAAAPPPRSRAAVFGWTAAGAVACAAAALLWLRTPAPEPRVEVAPVVAEAPEPAVAPVAPVVAPASPRRFTPHLRAVASEDWKGEVRSPDARTTRLAMDRGFCVLDFTGGEGRVLRVAAPDVDIEVIGTRFFVEADPGSPTRVGVISGKIEIASHGQIEVLGPGQVRAYDASGAFTPPKDALRSVAYHDAPALERAAEAPKVAEAPKPAPKAAPKPAQRAAPRAVNAAAQRSLPPPPPPFDAVGALTEAEGLARAGRVDDALAAYARIVAADAPRSLRELARYEQARLWGFAKKDLSRAQVAFERLARTASPEIRRQAALARCELFLAPERCRAARCLDTLSHAEDAALRAEAIALTSAWGVAEGCLDHKDTPSPRLKK